MVGGFNFHLQTTRQKDTFPKGGYAPRKLFSVFWGTFVSVINVVGVASIVSVTAFPGKEPNEEQEAALASLLGNGASE